MFTYIFQYVQTFNSLTCGFYSHFFCQQMCVACDFNMPPNASTEPHLHQPSYLIKTLKTPVFCHSTTISLHNLNLKNTENIFSFQSFLRLGPVIYPGVECFLHCNKKTYICQVIGSDCHDSKTLRRILGLKVLNTAMYCYYK